MPVLADHPEEADGGVEMEGLACPVNYAPIEHDGSIAHRLADEIASLSVWYGLGLERSGRTAFGGAGMTIAESADAVGAAIDGVLPDPTDELSAANILRLAGEDLKAWITEAADAQPGEMSAYALKAWFWTQTVAGEALLAAYTASKSSDNKSWRNQAPTLIPAELR